MILPSDTRADGRRFDAAELEYLRQVLEIGTLNCTKGTFVSRLEKQFASVYGGHGWHCTAVTSGTAAIHCALAALNLEPGSEVITTSITDMGAISPILYQGLVPVFCDVDPLSCNVTAESIARATSPRTGAIIVTHLFGSPCDMAPILDFASKRGLPVIEDTAQAPFALYQGRRLGTLGAIGCFSLQQGKHMTCGEGGLVITADEALARHIRLFHDKAWGYGEPNPDHEFLAPNYRMTELQGAVALAQLDKVDAVVRDRQSSATDFLNLIGTLPGVVPQVIPPRSTSVFWKVALRFLDFDVRRIATILKDEYDIVSAPRYVQKPAFECRVFTQRNTFGTSHWPLEDWSAPKRELLPGTYDALEHLLVLPWNENYLPQHVEYIATALKSAVERVSLS